MSLILLQTTLFSHPISVVYLILFNIGLCNMNFSPFFPDENDTNLSYKQSLYTLFKGKLSMSCFQLMLVLKFYVNLMTGSS